MGVLKVWDVGTIWVRIFFNCTEIHIPACSRHGSTQRLEPSLRNQLGNTLAGLAKASKIR
jgi:hypothetical protein